MSTIKEALHALGTVEREDYLSEFDLQCQLKTIRAALNAAAQEASDWGAIEVWCLASPQRSCTWGHVQVGSGTPPWYAMLWEGVTGNTCRNAVTGDSRVEALTKAAEWCRAQTAGKS